MWGHKIFVADADVWLQHLDYLVTVFTQIITWWTFNIQPFGWCSWSQFHEHNFVFIWKKQKKSIFEPQPSITSLHLRTNNKQVDTNKWHIRHWSKMTEQTICRKCWLYVDLFDYCRFDSFLVPLWERIGTRILYSVSSNFLLHCTDFSFTDNDNWLYRDTDYNCYISPKIQIILVPYILEH